jgi:polysaccharide export outer membrane protein
MRTLLTTVLALAVLVPGGLARSATSPPAPQAAPAQKPTTSAARPVSGPSIATEPGFIIGSDDVLGVNFWRDQEMSGDVTVRPDGMITLPLIRDIKAAGLTPDQLADRIQEAAREFIADASVTVVVRQLNSRRVFITGEVTRPGAYALTSAMTVMQLIAVAGGLTEFAESKDISIMRVEGGQAKTLPFNYKDVARGKKKEQNVQLKPGDTVVVP